MAAAKLTKEEKYVTLIVILLYIALLVFLFKPF